MFSFCWTKSVVSKASDAVTLLHIAYLLTWLAISISRFTHVHFRIRCYDVTLLQIAYLKPGCQSVQFVSHGHFCIGCYAVAMLRCLI